MKTEFKTISQRARNLLNRQEGLDVDFKRDLSGLKTDDLVAFANSEKGGAILIGVDETQMNGVQRGKVVGCPVTDQERLKIVHKAEDCIPPVDIEIYFENLSKNPFFRVEIPSGEHKPYCTKKGTYTVRGDGSNRPLLPDHLLPIFIESKGEDFLKKFKQATTRLESDVQNATDKINEMRTQVSKNLDVLKAVHNTQIEVEQRLREIFSSASNAEGLADEVMSYSAEALLALNDLEKWLDAHLGRIREEIEDNNMRLTTLLDSQGLEDPVIKKMRGTIIGFYQHFHELNPDRDQREFIESLASSFPKIPKETISQWILDQEE